MRKTASNANIGMILRYFTTKTRHAQINNVKHEFNIISQKETSGLPYPPQANQTTFKYQQETQKSVKQLKTINEPVAIIPEKVIFQ